jgi:6-pyruvoyltetrahydropterin/6-carboxytetrahydropterin synthase
LATATVCKRYKFSAAHFLPDHPSPCRNVHGHTFWVDIYASGDIQDEGDEKGMVVEYGRITRAWEKLERHLDHRNLNELFPYPTTERLAEWILEKMFEMVSEVSYIKVWEGPNQFVELGIDELDVIPEVPE